MARHKPTGTDINFDDDPNVISVDRMLEARSRLYAISNPYVGNKRKIVVDIADAMEKRQYRFSSMLDLFSGSSMVGLFFKLLGKKVTSNDLLTSSYYNALAFVENSKTIQLDFNSLKLNNPDKGDFVRTNYSTRFTSEEAEFLDNYRANLNNLTDKYEFAAGILAIEHYVMSNCFLGGRLNRGQILAELKHRQSHDRNYDSSPMVKLEMNFDLTSIPFFEGVEGSALNLDCLDALTRSGEQEMAYIDPPYGQSQSDYATMFAFCEEYIYGKKIQDLPHLATSKKFVNIKDYDKHFQEVLDNARHIPQWAISYNDSSWADISIIKSAVEKFRKSVDVVNIDYEYKYRKAEKSSGTEYLILAR